MQANIQTPTHTILKTNKIKLLLIRLSLLFLYALGLYVSLKVALETHFIDSDSVQTLILWKGVQQHGLEWIKSWVFTQDNWILTLQPIHSFLFFLFGEKPASAIITGWLIFVASAFTVGLIALELKAKKSFTLIPIMLLFMGLFTYQAGFVAYSLSHNITNLFGLLSLLILIKWTHSKKCLLMLLLFLLQVASGISDPWMLPTYTLPITLVAFLSFFRSKDSNEKMQYLWLFLVMLSSITLTKTLFLGALDFLQKTQFAIGSWTNIKANTFFIANDLGNLFNLSLSSTKNSAIINFISLAITAILYFISQRIMIIRTSSASQTIFFATVFLSIGGVSLAFILSDTAQSYYSARYLINVLYLAPLAIAIAVEKNWQYLNGLIKFYTAAAALLFVASGFISNFHLIKKPGFSVQATPRANELIKLLTKEKLNYGYGPFWGSQANAVTQISNNNIIIRPVIFDTRSGKISFNIHRAESSSQWYKSSDTPTLQKKFFVLVQNDGEQCPIPQVCIDGITQQFGKPISTLHYKDSTILIWNHPLVGWANNYIKINPNTEILFNTKPTTNWPGWSGPESWGTWSDGKTALILLQLAHTHQKDVKLIIKGHAFLAKQHPSQEIDILVNKHHIATLTYNQKSNDGTRMIIIPQQLIAKNKGKLFIKLNFLNPASPKKLGLSNDNRQLGLGLVSLKLEETGIQR